MIGGCSGVLIGERAVLSAWHCFEDDEGRWIAAAGSVANNRYAFRVTRGRAVRLSLPAAGPIDVGVYCLDRPAPMMSLPVISREGVRKDESLDVVGFGLVGGAPAPPADLREVLPRQGTTKVESVATIAGVPRFVTARGGEPGAQSVACHGDSGGPVYRRGTLQLVGMTEQNPTGGINTEACGMPMQSVHLSAIRIQVEAAIAACAPR